MLAVEVKVPDTNRLISTPHVRSIGCISRTPLADTPLLSSRYQAEIFLDDPLVEVGHFLVLFLSHVACSYFLTTGVYISHIHFAHAAEFSTFSNDLKHLGNGILLTGLSTAVFIIRDVHLRADTINLGHTIILPFLNPVDETLHFLVVIPVRLQIVVVDEEFDILGAILTGQATSLTHIVQIAHVVLPEEILAADIPCTALIAFRML